MHCSFYKTNYTTLTLQISLISFTTPNATRLRLLEYPDIDETLQLGWDYYSILIYMELQPG